ncbi:MAG: hypothetical protein CVT77_09995 [Alphaproteobacteria bacterium HGW-Alphaproteobacteria-16]|nr:MAG: hypothetical protein CVT77_09995 [Alphaproteobacteria bacterium HGW-Alphaproteobacteria-16]
MFELENLESVLFEASDALRDRLFATLYPPERRYYFLFKQGLKKTNMAFVELYSLLQMHCDRDRRSKDEFFQIISQAEASQYLNEHVRDEDCATDADRSRLIKSVKSYFENKIIIESYFTSATAFIPNNININLQKIVLEAGYIHSCGYLIFSENTQLISPDSAEISLNFALSMLKDDEKFLLVPYCHEDFTSRDRAESEFLKDGLDDVKIHIGKSYISEVPLHQFLINFVEKNSSFGASAPANYKESKTRFEEKFPDLKMVTFWIVSDSIISDRYDETLGERHLICYRQLYKNDNAYHNYEENKPAWVSHTTLPHSLAGAMINVSRPWLPRENPVICDPFCGSGTIYLEAQKFPILRCETSDKSPLAEKILADNIAFFKLDHAELVRIVDALEHAVDRNLSIQPKSARRSGSARTTFESVVSLLDEWVSECDGDFLNLSAPSVEKGFSKIGDQLEDRILLYVALRASVRGRVAVYRETEDWADVFKKELGDLLGQMKNHIKILERVGGETSEFVQGSYSAVAIPPKPYERKYDLFGSGDFSLRSVEDLPKGIYDAIICDPPYGFNTETDRWAAEDFSNMMIPSLVEALKRDGGQLILAAPRTSFSGRKIPLTLRSDYITRAILAYCAQSGRQCWRPAMVYPKLMSAFVGPPYYWTAEKSLNRKILHFWIRRKP